MPAIGERTRRRLILAAAAVVVGTAAVIWLALAGDGEAPPPAPEPPPSPQPVTYPLEVTLRRLKGIPVAGEARRRHLREPAEAVRQTFTELYLTGFVDPARWEGGLFPSLSGFFAGDAKREAQRDLEDLSLGKAAAHLSSVRPEWARLDVRFLLGPSRRPVAAQTSMRFAGTGFATDGSVVPIRHSGEYVLHLTGGSWRIVAYDVEGGLGAEAVP